MGKHTAGAHSAPPRSDKYKPDTISGDAVTGRKEKTRASDIGSVRIPGKKERVIYDGASEYEEAINKPIKATKRNNKHTGLHVLIVLFTLLVAGAVGAFGGIKLITDGPSAQFKKMFVRTFRSTGTLYNVPYLIMSHEEVDFLSDSTQDAESGEYRTESDSIVKEVVIEEVPEDLEPVELVDIAGASWHGKMIIVRDPSRVTLAIPDRKGREYGSFLMIKDYCKKYGAMGGVTGGGFSFTSGVPNGFIIYDGEIVSDESNGAAYTCVGLTEDHKLVVGKKTREEALAEGLKYCVSWWPLLVVNGEKQVGLGGGYSARAAIGQRADGTILLVTIEGRMLTSFGASLDDLVNFMYDQGCVNACNLDSGRSAVMVWNNEDVTKIAIGAGIETEERTLPNAFIVLPEENNG